MAKLQYQIAWSPDDLFMDEMICDRDRWYSMSPPQYDGVAAARRRYIPESRLRPQTAM